MSNINTLILTATLALLTGCATPNAVEQDSKVAWEGTKKVSGEVWEDTIKPLIKQSNIMLRNAIISVWKNETQEN